MKKNRVLCFILALVLSINTFPVNSAEAAFRTMRIEWLNVGAGDSMYIALPNGKNVLIDGGTTSKGSTVVKYLKSKKVTTIDYMISTHPDADHVGGLQQVFKSLKVKNFYYPSDVAYTTNTAKSVITLAKKEQSKIVKPKRGNAISGGNGCVLRFVHDNKNYKSDNEDSLAVYIDYGNLEVLVCGDNEKGSQETIEKHNVDILQLPHHGSKYATSANFIKRFDPEYVVVSTDGKRYGHPNVETFKRCYAYDKNMKVYRTDKNGIIKLSATKTRWSISNKYASVGAYTSSQSIVKPAATKAPVSGASVYTTKTGSKYHADKNCRGLNNAKSIFTKKKTDAVNLGLTPCSYCY
ncbi:MAG: MBL fold metallo-hydrolase [Lachnospiraceae bacterium]|nr:MBL fold metallo-hydrolase [Lachnospiraceae bacterium]